MPHNDYNVVKFGEPLRSTVGLNAEPLGRWTDSSCLKWSKWSGFHEKGRIPITAWKARERNSAWSMSAKCNGTWTHHVAGKHTGALAGAPPQSSSSATEKTHMGHRTMRVCWVEIVMESRFRDTWHKQAYVCHRLHCSLSPGCGGQGGLWAVIRPERKTIEQPWIIRWALVVIRNVLFLRKISFNWDCEDFPLCACVGLFQVHCFSPKSKEKDSVSIKDACAGEWFGSFNLWVRLTLKSIVFSLAHMSSLKICFLSWLTYINKGLFQYYFGISVVILN